MAGEYSPGTATAEAIGATDAGYVDGSGVPWDTSLRQWNTRTVERRAELRAVDARDRAGDLRRRLRALSDQPATTWRVLGMGDSLVRGERSADGTGWRGWLRDLLDQADVDTGPIPYLAYNGGTLRDLAPNVAGALAEHDPDTVLLYIGTNDTGDMADWQARYATVVDQILAHSPTTRVACARMLPAAALAAGQATINGYITSVASARLAGGRVVLADMAAPVPPGVPGEDPSWTWCWDGTHPMDTGYLWMARQWMTALAPWLPASP